MRLTPEDLAPSLRAGEVVTGYLPSGIEVTIRALSRADMDAARRRATMATQVDPTFGTVVAGIVAKQARALADSGEDAPSAGEAEARVLYRVSKQDPEAYEAYRDLQRWNAAVYLEMCAGALVACNALGITSGQSVAQVADRLRAIHQQGAADALVVDLFLAVRAWSDGGPEGKALSGSPPGSTSASAEVSGAAAAAGAAGASST